MKKKASKIRLHRETLGRLEESLRHVGGGLSLTCYPNFCDFSGFNTCQTCKPTCNSNLC
jgi:hypothetical protein